MSSPEFTEVSARITSIALNYNQYHYSSKIPYTRADPEHVTLLFGPHDTDKVNAHSGSIIIKKAEALRMNLMAGDVVKVRITKTV
jgi:hypothetical protein